MTDVRQALEQELALVLKMQSDAVEPVRKRRRVDEEAAAAPFETRIADLRTRIEEEKSKSIWLVRARNHSLTSITSGAYMTEPEARENCPSNTRVWSYWVERVPLNRTKADNTCEEPYDPPSK